MEISPATDAPHSAWVLIVDDRVRSKGAPNMYPTTLARKIPTHLFQMAGLSRESLTWDMYFERSRCAKFLFQLAPTHIR